MPESPPIGNPSLVHSRLRAAGVWLMHRRRLTVLALLLAFIVGGAVWASSAVAGLVAFACRPRGDRALSHIASHPPLEGLPGSLAQ